MNAVSAPSDVCEGCYKRAGQLVCQFPMVIGGRRYVFRRYLCRWCRATDNKRKTRSRLDWKPTTVVEWKPDDEVTDD